ncbi:hypothetical protein XU18_2244 [Perkinsela sp. CCAP 1560/4]|nr:hypothetical protein XU18_2244 [Perkinsela sp. CCAP 1560/4]|eukprot:KNH06973.1 hypothetical protein XU18_2244 [Perkinsela sp. CCAP 1560/4]
MWANYIPRFEPQRVIGPSLASLPGDPPPISVFELSMDGYTSSPTTLRRPSIVSAPKQKHGESLEGSWLPPRRGTGPTHHEEVAFHRVKEDLIMPPSLNNVSWRHWRVLLAHDSHYFSGLNSPVISAVRHLCVQRTT